jgi:hypothetical protein
MRANRASQAQKNRLFKQQILTLIDPGQTHQRKDVRGEAIPGAGAIAQIESVLAPDSV